MNTQYENIFIKSLVEDNKLVPDFNLTDDFYKTFVRRNRKSGFMLYMLSGLKTLVNTILTMLREQENIIIGAWLIGYNNYNKLYFSVMTKQKLDFNKPKGCEYAFIKNVVNTDNSLLIQICINDDIFYRNKI